MALLFVPIIIRLFGSVNYTVSKFCRIFKKGMQKGFNEYVTEERVRLAKEYLKDCSIPINEVSLHCGYVNAKYFSVVFKKVTGETPRDYRFRCERGRG